MTQEEIAQLQDLGAVPEEDILLAGLRVSRDGLDMMVHIVFNRAMTFANNQWCEQFAHIEHVEEVVECGRASLILRATVFGHPVEVLRGVASVMGYAAWRSVVMSGIDWAYVLIRVTEDIPKNVVTNETSLPDAAANLSDLA